MWLMMRPATKRRWEGRWKPLLVLAMLAAALLCGTLNSDASSIIAATLNREGLVTELSFTLDSPAPKLHLSAHGNELWIDLDRTGLQIPARPLYGRELAPLGIVRAFSPGGLHARAETLT